MMLQFVEKTTIILRSWGKLYGYLLNFNQSRSIERSKIYIKGPDIPDSSIVDLELATGN